MVFSLQSRLFSNSTGRGFPRWSAEQIGMCSCCSGRKDELVLKNLIHQEPVWLYMSFPKIVQVACQLMVLAFWRECRSRGKHIQDGNKL